MVWISVDERLPDHGQHVLVWEDRFNVYAFPSGHVGDDGKGRVRMGDAIFFSGEVSWNERSVEDKSSWKNKEDYKSMNAWDEWSGHGPCSFSDVTHWMPLPEPPKGEV